MAPTRRSQRKIAEPEIGRVKAETRGRKGLTPSNRKSPRKPLKVNGTRNRGQRYQYRDYREADDSKSSLDLSSHFDEQFSAEGNGAGRKSGMMEKAAAFQQIRLEQIKKREKILESLDLLNLKQELDTHGQLKAKSRAKPNTQSQRKSWFKVGESDSTDVSAVIKRRSSRIMFKNRTFDELTPEEQELERKRMEAEQIQRDAENMRVRDHIPDGPFPLSDVYQKDKIGGISPDEILQEIQIATSCGSDPSQDEENRQTTSSFWGASKQELVKDMGRMMHMPSMKIKMCKERLYSTCFHPDSTDPLVFAAGDKTGSIGICDFHLDRRDAEEAPPSWTFKPHNMAVSCLKFGPEPNSSRLFSASYDGTIRYLDIQTGIFSQVFSCEDERDGLCKYFAFRSRDNMVVALHTGELVLLDTREAQSKASIYDLGKNRFRTVDVHPGDNNLLATSSFQGDVGLWDARYLRKGKAIQSPIFTLPHGKAVASAFFSPITGNRILTSSTDDVITVFDISDHFSTNRLIIPHNNHVGRWLTPFRPCWHPLSEELFVSGSMNRPRIIEVWDTENTMKPALALGRDALTSVCSINAVHAKVKAVVGVNSSGYAHLWL